MNSRRRCTACKDYFPAEQITRQGVCSEECLRDLADRARKKHERRQREVVVRPSGPNGDVRRRVRRRDGNKCRWCCRTSGLQVHHIHYRSESGPNTVTNLITLCLECHALVHSNKRLYKPILLGLIWMGYVEGKMLTGPQFMRWYPHLVPQDTDRVSHTG